MWCVQEVILAPKVTVFSGPDEISWKTFLRGLRLALTHHHQFSKTIGSIQCYSSLDEKLESPSHPLRPQETDIAALFFLKLLLRYRTRKATDPRDKVYALLGLVAKHFPDFDIAPSYRITPTRLFRNIAAYIIRHSGGNSQPTIPRLVG